jgi:hypothetical protein
MQPRNGFICVEHSAEGSDTSRAAWRVTGADLSAVAFIPRGFPEELSPSGLTQPDTLLAPGVASLFAECTDAPPTSFEGPRSYVNALRQRNHRGALAIVEPTAYLDRDDRIVKVTFRLSSGRVGAGFVRRNGGVTFGVGAATDKRRFNVTVGERYARIDCWQRFVMGHAGDLDGRFPGAEVAPLGWLLFTYFLFADGTAQGWCASSYLPSAWFYRDYVRMHRRDVEQATDVEVEAVLNPKPDMPTGTRWACLDTSTGCINAVA